jgi:hypothetical protein
MNTLTIRTLGLPWLAAFLLTGLAMMALAGHAVVPSGALRSLGASAPVVTSPASGSPVTSTNVGPVSDPFSVVKPHDHLALHDQLTAIRSLLDAPGGDLDTLAVTQARARLGALIATQDQSGPEPAQGAALAELVSRLDAAVAAIHQPAEAAGDDFLLKVGVALGIAGAVMALIAGPLAFGPARQLSTSLSLAAEGGRSIWGTDRRDEWGVIARQVMYLRDNTQGVSFAAPQQMMLTGPTEQLRETAEAMSRLLLDSGHELSRMRGEAGEAVNNAVMLGARLADAVLDAESKLQARVQWGQAGGDADAASPVPAGGFVDPAALFSAASAHADRLEEAATRALAAATVLPAAAERIETAIAGLDRMAETVAANNESLADLAARAGAAVAMLPEAAGRIEAAAAGLGGVASRTSSAAEMLPQAAQLIAQASSDLGRAAEAVATNAAGLNEAVARHTDAASTLPTMAERIETAVAGLDRSAAALGDATDHARISSRAVAASASNTEVAQRAIGEAAQRMGEMGAQLPALVHQIVDATEGLYRGVGTVVQAAERVDETAHKIAIVAANQEAAHAGLTTSAQRVAVLGEQLPSLAEQIVLATNSLDHSAATVMALTRSADETTRTVASLAASAEAAQTSLAGAAQRMASFGEELPGIAFQIADATANLDRSVGTVQQAAENAEQSTAAVASLAADAGSAQAALSATLPHLTVATSALPLLAEQIQAALGGLDGSTQVLIAAQGALTGTLPLVSASVERLPVVAERFEAMLAAMDGTASMVLDAATSALEAGRAAEASATEAAVAQASITENLRQTVEHTSQALPALTSRIDESVISLRQCTSSVVEVTAGALRATDATLASQTSLTSAVECIVTVGDGLAEKLPGMTAGMDEQIARLDEQVAAIRQANIGVTVRQIADLATTMAETLPPLSSRISAAITHLEGSAASLSEIGTTAGQTLPAAAARIDDVLAGLDATMQIMAGAAQTAAASMTESAGTQSALAQTVQCMASVGEALPSLAMRLEGTLGALDRSTDTIVAAANDVAEAGRALGVAGAAKSEDGIERRPPATPTRPAIDAASMRRLQSVASALAMAGNGSRG